MASLGIVAGAMWKMASVLLLVEDEKQLPILERSFDFMVEGERQTVQVANKASGGT